MAMAARSSSSGFLPLALLEQLLSLFDPSFGIVPVVGFHHLPPLACQRIETRA